MVEQRNKSKDLKEELGEDKMKKQPLKEMLKKIHGGHLLNEGDGHPNLLKKNKEVAHN